MNIIEFNSSSKSKIAFCLIDNTINIKDNFSKEIVKNQSDFTISNLYIKGFDVYQSFDEDQIIKHVSKLDYSHALVFSTGTEFINGYDFFNSLENLIKENFLVAGHILDRKTAYYELHHQCYLINLNLYRNLNYPEIGKTELGISHSQTIPLRSLENIHDDYTPVYIKPGTDIQTYYHKCHGWNIISVALKNDLPLKVFDNTMRNNKKYLYPESKKDFEKNLSWIYHKNQYCLQDFIHKDNTEWSNNIEGKFNQLLLPASGTLYLDLIDQGTVIFYDYNQKSLDYWKDNCYKKSNIEYKFVKTDLLSENNLLDYCDFNLQKTFINFSNIFCYEGTASLFPLSYRVYKENQILQLLQKEMPNSTINFTSRAATGFSNNLKMIGTAKDFTLTNIEQLKKPTWHVNADWINF